MYVLRRMSDLRLTGTESRSIVRGELASADVSEVAIEVNAGWSNSWTHV